MQEFSDEKKKKWCKFIKDHLSVRSFVLFVPNNNGKICCGFSRPHLFLDSFSKVLSNQKNNYFDQEGDFLNDVEYIKEISKIFPIETNKIPDDNIPDYDDKQSSLVDIAMKAYRKGHHKKMKFREYLKWRLGVINDEQKPISIKKTTGLAFLSLAGMYWFFTPKTKPPIKILMGILNLFAVASLICVIVLNLSLYFLILTAIVYGLFVTASCIHVGCKRYKENVKQEEFGNTYNELMAYLKQGQTKPPQLLNDKIKNINAKKQEIKIKEEEVSKSSSEKSNYLE